MKKALYLLIFVYISLLVNARHIIPSKTEGIKTNEWKLHWHDEFNKKSTIINKWNTENGSPAHILSSRWHENIEVRGGHLQIKNIKQNKGGKNWTTGSITSKQKFKYGYFECRIKMSKATGVNNAFWLYCTNPSQKSNHCFEIDITEGHYPNESYNNIHDLGIKEKRCNNQLSQKHLVSPNIYGAYHRYGLEWNKDTITFFIDGKMVRTEPNLFCHDEGYIVLGTSVLKWAGEITPSIDGTSMSVDYVRVFKKHKGE